MDFGIKPRAFMKFYCTLKEDKRMYRIGVDLGGTNIAVGLVDENYRIVVKESTPTGAERPGEAVVDDIAKLCKKVCLAAGIPASETRAQVSPERKRARIFSP